MPQYFMACMIKKGDEWIMDVAPGHYQKFYDTEIDGYPLPQQTISQNNARKRPAQKDDNENEAKRERTENEENEEIMDDENMIIFPVGDFFNLDDFDNDHDETDNLRLNAQRVPEVRQNEEILEEEEEEEEEESDDDDEEEEEEKEEEEEGGDDDEEMVENDNEDESDEEENYSDNSDEDDEYATDTDESDEGYGEGWHSNDDDDDMPLLSRFFPRHFRALIPIMVQKSDNEDEEVNIID